MKFKTAVLTVLIAGGLAAGGFYGARYYRDTHKTPVEVVPVANVNASDSDMWYYDEFNYGNVIARDSQTVQLDTSRQLAEVYVKTGDNVKVGDKLLSYDTTLVQLQKEMQELAIQLLEINLLSEQKSLVKLQQGGSLASLEETGDDNTGESILDDEEEGDYAEPSDYGSDILDDFDSGYVSDAGDDGGYSAGSSDPFEDFYDDNGGGGNGDVSDNSGYDLSELIDDEEDFTYENTDPGSADTDSGEIDSGDDIQGGADSEDIDFEDMDADDIDADDVDADDIDLSDITGTDRESETETEQEEVEPIATSEVESVIESFFSTIGLLREQELDNLKSEYIDDALDMFQKKLAVQSTTVNISPNMLGETSTVYTYELSDTVTEQIDESLQEQLYQGYAWALVYDFLYNLNKLKVMMPSDRTPESLSNAEIASMDSQLRQTIDAFYYYTRNMDSDVMKLMLGDLREEFHTAFIEDEITADALLTRLVARSNSSQIIDDPEPETEETEKLTEADDDLSDVEDENASVPEEPVDNSYEIFMMEMEIRDIKLRIREEELKLAEYERALEESTVLATVAGLVKDAGTVDGGGNSDAFIVIGGEKGLYLEGTISEMKLDTIHIGDTITGQDWDSYMPFTAKITEISPYPTAADSFWGDGNVNASNYPFYAYIEEDYGLSEGTMCEFNFSGGTSKAGITIPAYFIRTDISGRYYVLIAAKDKTLMKKYVKTGSTGWNGTEIKSGLADTDLIAFPYGYNVVEGAPTKQVDNLSGMENYFY